MKKKHSHKILSWILLVIFIYNISGSYLTFFFWRLILNEQLEEVASTLPDDMLTLIKTSEEKKSGEEISIDGKQYDIIRTKYIQGIFYCYCLHDLNEEIVASSVSNDPVFSKACNDIAKAIKTIQIKNAEKYISAESLLYFDKQLPNKIFHKQASRTVSKLHLKIFSPPPEV